MLRGTNSFHEALHAADPSACDDRAHEHGYRKSAGHRALSIVDCWRSREYSRPECPLTRGGTLSVLLAAGIDEDP